MSIDLTSLLTKIFSNNTFIYGVLSSPQKKDKSNVQKTSIRPIKIKEETLFQVSDQINQKVIHQNISSNDCLELLMNRILEFKQLLICTSEADYQILVSKNHSITILKKPPSKSLPNLLHNIKKQYVIEENLPVPFLIEVGIMTKEGKVIAQKRDKFKQINRFLEMVRDILPHLNKNEPIRIVDFGCGKAYLTFALYHYLHTILKHNIHIIGLDLKDDVVKNCQMLADKLGYTNLKFFVGDIGKYQTNEKINMVVSLHACDTATDAALEKAVNWKADVILSVPCCQHELYNQIENTDLSSLLRHGILRERFAALATDAARAQLLEIAGYQVQVLEFVDFEHTPKNLLIRATKKTHTKKTNEQAIKDYLAFKNLLNITPCLEKLLALQLNVSQSQSISNDRN